MADRETLAKKHEEYKKSNFLFVIIMLGLSALNVPLILFGVTRFYFSMIFVDIIMALDIKVAFVPALLAVAALFAVTFLVRKKFESVYCYFVGSVTLIDLIMLLWTENPINYILSVLAHMWVIYTFIALLVLQHKLRGIS